MQKIGDEWIWYVHIHYLAHTYIYLDFLNCNDQLLLTMVKNYSEIIQNIMRPKFDLLFCVILL